MAEFTYNPVQEVEQNQAILLNNSIRCNRGYIFHDNESGVVTLMGIVNSSCGCFARYQITFNGNIAIPETGGTVEEISIALANEGEPIQTSRARVTPAAVDEYFNVTSTAIITVPRGCCAHVSVENTSTQTINVQNANLVIARIA